MGREGETLENINRRFKIYKSDLIKFGYQQGCLGCKMMKEGKPAQSHNESCRKRIEAKLKESKDKRTVDQHDGIKLQESSDKRPADDHQE